jgi:hypothetical protein
MRESAAFPRGSSALLGGVFVTGEGSSPLRVEDVRVGAAYETARGEERRRIAALKGPRRIALGESLALVFESRDTIRATLEEALRTERVDDPARVASEIEAFNAVVPAPGELVAVLFLEVADPADLNSALLRLDGVDRSIFMEIGGARVPGVADTVFAPGEGAVAFPLRFRIDPAQRESIRSGAPMSIGSDHHNVALTVALDEVQREAITEEL